MTPTPPRPPYALVRPPATSLADGIVTFVERQPLDLELAGRQWRSYVNLLAQNGFPPIEVARDDALPDSVFIEDAIVMFGDLAVVTNPRQPARNPEIVAVEKAVRELGMEVAHIMSPATLDGGDVLKVGSQVYVGRTGSTNADGVAQLAALVEPRGYTVIGVPVTKALHLKSAVTALPDGTVIGYGPVVDDPSVFPQFLEVAEESGAHVVVLDEQSVLMSSAAPETATLLRERGLRVEAVDISEYEKLEGCVTCLSVRVRP
ncbi:MAG: dimethylargininase [Nocardioidaceae bacterium]